MRCEDELLQGSSELGALAGERESHCTSGVGVLGHPVPHQDQMGLPKSEVFLLPLSSKPLGRDHGRHCGQQRMLLISATRGAGLPCSRRTNS